MNAIFTRYDSMIWGSCTLHPQQEISHAGGHKTAIRSARLANTSGPHHCDSGGKRGVQASEIEKARRRQRRRILKTAKQEEHRRSWDDGEMGMKLC
ncbi:MAG: hypothetical protein CVU38_05990 [Chloroflexi bacterium HGW-Chloroflexi-1]|nr:MAG: hypothetical protein CVU38_05990 [Chloroflexi bacterium HGW-Chloroflexi-1]